MPSEHDQQVLASTEQDPFSRIFLLDKLLYPVEQARNQRMRSYTAFNGYQQAVEEFAVYPVIGHVLVYPALELVDEAGEVAGKIKKLMRDDQGVLTPERREAIALEMGDVLFPLARLATHLGMDLSEIAQMNLDKLNDRKARNVISGEGDNR